MIPGNGGAQSVYDYWLGMLPQFFAQMGAAVPPSVKADSPTASLPFPADQVARAAAMTSDALQSLAQSYAPTLQSAGVPGLLAQWAAAAMAAAGNAMPASTPAAWLPLQQMQKAWADFGNQMVGGTTQTYTTAFDRTYGALGDALGLGPMRKLQAAGQEIMAATLAQNETRAAYAMLVQSAIAAGVQKLLQRLADMAQHNERVDSVLALMRMWAVATEEAVHETLQSEHGLQATAALTRAGLACRRKTQGFAAIIADTLDMATRRDLDDAYREIQALKRELRSMRSSAPVKATATKPRTRGTKRATTK
jgi:hypothetical protein